MKDFIINSSCSYSTIIFFIIVYSVVLIDLYIILKSNFFITFINIQIIFLFFVYFKKLMFYFIVFIVHNLLILEKNELPNPKPGTEPVSGETLELPFSLKKKKKK